MGQGSLPNRPESFEVQREHEDPKGAPARTHLCQEETCEFIHRLSKNTINKPVLIEAVGCKNRD